MAFPKFPYTDFHRLNADWILDTMRKLVDIIKGKSDEVDAAVETVEGYNTRLTAAETKANGAVRFDAAQSLNSTQKAQARTNIGAAASSDIPDLSDVVRTSEQTLTSTQKAQARTNIGAAASSDIPDVSDVVRTSAQTLTSTQKAQARTNIDAVANRDAEVESSITVKATNINAVTLTIDNIGTQDIIAMEGELGNQSVLLRGIAAPSANSDAANKKYVDDSISAIPAVTDAVRVVSQSFTDAQKAIARGNIDAEQTPLLVGINYNSSTSAWVATKSLDDIMSAYGGDRQVIIYFFPQNLDICYLALPAVDEVQNVVEVNILCAHDPTNAINTEGWTINITNSNNADVVTVTPIEGRLIPIAGYTNAGKVLTVESNGKPGWELPGPVVVSDTSSTTPTIASAEDNHIYKFTQDLTSLSLTSGTGAYMICFHSGSTATTTSFPVSILGLDDFVPETDTYYEINVMDGRAVWNGWADPAVE